MFFFGRKLQKHDVSAVCVGTIVLAFLMACGAVLQYTSWAATHDRQPYEKILYTWLGTDTGHLNYLTHDGTQASFRADAGFLLDPLSSIWLLFVTGVGMLIHIYSTGYMAHEGGYYRFFGYLNLFMFSMLTLILANNYVLMFVGWEGVGLCSYLLIGFYFHRKSASDAANKAFIVNRIGDAGFLLGMFFIAWLCGSLRFIDVTVFARAGSHSPETLTYITAATLLLFVGACGKSAQLPLYIWLPDAMEGPTPVCALIHAATMVTAGVYMVARSNALFILAPTSMKTVAIVGALHRHLRRLDWPGAKRHQARPGLLDRLAARIHVSRARSRSLLGRRLPRFHARILQGSALPRSRLGDPCHERRAGHAQHGRPAQAHPCYLLDHADRDAGHRGLSAVRRILFQRRNPMADVDLAKAAPIASCGASGTSPRLMTAFYMFRLIWLTFYSKPRMSHEVEHHIHESPKSMTMPLVVLAVCRLVRRIPWLAAQSRRFRPFRTLPRPGLCKR